MEVNENLRRLLQPKSLAIAGLGAEYGPRHASAERMIEDGREVYIINPNRPTVMGLDTYPSLTAIGRPIDALVSLISAEASTALVEEAAALDVGGVVVGAAGFADQGGGSGGRERQERLANAARRAGMALIGPNCLGYANPRTRVSLGRRISPLDVPGGISVISQSGSIMRWIVESIQAHRYLGMDHLLSVGNEAVTDMADYINFLAVDPGTDAIVLGIEQIRRPQEFFEAVRLAIANGKALVALKLGRSERSQKMAATHTGSLAGDAWVYDVALAQAGVLLARDPDDAVDRLQFIAQLGARAGSTAARNVSFLTSAGGMASLTEDIAQQEKFSLPALDHLLEWLGERVPGVTVANPLDVPELYWKQFGEIATTYAADPQVDVVAFPYILGDEDAAVARNSIQTFVEVAEKSSKPFVLTTYASALPGTWVDDVRGPVLVGKGIRSTLVGLRSLEQYGASRQRIARSRTPDASSRADVMGRPAAIPQEVPEGRLLPFTDAMELISGCGVPTAPYVVVVPEADLASVNVPFDAPYVAKLADVAHRTELGAVRTGIDDAGLADAITELRAVAVRHSVPGVVAIQPQIASSGEVLIGVQATELGPLVVFGIGGVFVNVLKRVGGRMAPFDIAEARGLLDEFADLEVVRGFRGEKGWDLDQLAEILVAVGRLAAGGAQWIDSIDMNPLINGPDGFVAVDVLCLVT